MHKRWKFWNTLFQYVCQKTQIYTQLVEFTFNHIVSKSMQKSIQHERKVSSRRCYPSMLHNHFIDLPPILEKKKYKVEKNHIYTTQWQEYTVQLNKEKSN